MTADLILGCSGPDQAVQVERGRAEEEGHGPDQGQRLPRVGDRPDGLRAHREHNSQVPRVQCQKVYILLHVKGLEIVLLTGFIDCG